MAEINLLELDKQIQKIRKNRKTNHRVVISIITIIAVFALILIIGMSMNKLKAPSPVGSAINCQTEKCFINAANNCDLAIYEKKIETILIQFKSTKNCELHKKVLSIDKEEPESVKKLFKGTKMICPYKKGKFDEKYINQISFDILTCKGDMLEAIKKIL